MGKVTESIYSGKNSGLIIPLADVQHIELHPKNSIPGIMIITKHTRWDGDVDLWANAIWISDPEGIEFRRAWCNYRAELEAETLADISPEGGRLTSKIMAMHDETVAMLKG